MEKINIIPTLLNYPERELLWSKGDGYVMFKCVRKVGDSDVVVAMDSSLSEILYDAYGFKIGVEDDERRLFFVKKECKGLQAVKPSEVRFDIRVFKPYDKVLAQQIDGVWVPDIIRGWVFNKDGSSTIYGFSSIEHNNRLIPYNNETKHLAFTLDECPKFYRYWENVTNTNASGDTTPKVNKFKAWFSRLFRA